MMHEMVSIKPGKFPRAVALEAVREVLHYFTPACERVIVAGSLRRRKQAVGDAEILFIPLCAVEQDLFGKEVRRVELTDQALDLMIKKGIIAKRETANNHLSWGAKNKFAVHCTTGLPLDFFTATNENWWNYLVCRTGSMENNIAIASAAECQGLKWRPYDKGFTSGDHWIVVKSEEDVFKTVGLPYKQPYER